MESLVIDRIENKRFEKNIKLFKWLAIISIIPIIGKLILNPEILTGKGTFLDYAINFIPVFLFFEYSRKAKNWGGQFIEWKEGKISFKLRKVSENTIEYSNIESIEIKLDNIIITLKDGEKYDLNIEDYTEYEDRLRIKENFKRIMLDT